MFFYACSKYYSHLFFNSIFSTTKTLIKSAPFNYCQSLWHVPRGNFTTNTNDSFRFFLNVKLPKSAKSRAMFCRCAHRHICAHQKDNNCLLDRFFAWTSKRQGQTSPTIQNQKTAANGRNLELNEKSPIFRALTSSANVCVF